MLLSTAPLESVPHIVSLLSPESFCHCYPFFAKLHPTIDIKVLN